MTLDEAIKHAEEVAKEQEELYRLCPVSESMFHCDGTKDCKTLKNGKNKGCRKCAEEHQQLAEWLKDYQQVLKERHFDDASPQEPCDDCISREETLKTLMDEWTEYDRELIDYLFEKIDKLPSVTPQPKMGQWITGKDEYGDVYEAVCSCCDKNGNHKWAYCPNCGYKMQKVKDE